MFYSNEHEPIHVHGKFQGNESKAEIIIDNGEVKEIHIKDRARNKLSKLAQDFFSYSRRKNRRIASYATVLATPKMDKKTS